MLFNVTCMAGIDKELFESKPWNYVLELTSDLTRSGAERIVAVIFFIVNNNCSHCKEAPDLYMYATKRAICHP